MVEADFILKDTIPFKIHITSFTGGSISSEACGGSEYVNCGPSLIKATGEWNPLLKSRKPDISTIERTSTGTVAVRVEVPEEDIGRWLCAGNATGDVMENFVDKMCLKMDASGSKVLSFEGSVASSIFTENSQDSGFAICTHDFSSAGGNTCSVPRMITVGVEAFWPVRMDSQSLGCAEKDRFGTLGCLGEDVVAYAPYDLVGDLNMYARNPYASEREVIKLPVKTNGGGKMVGDYFVPSRQWIDIFNKSFYYRKEFYSADPSTGAGNISFVGPSGGNAEKGADNGIILNAWYNGYLAYDLSELKLGNTDIKLHFRIKGSSLLETTWYPTLFTLESINWDTLCFSSRGISYNDLVLQECWWTYKVFQRITEKNHIWIESDKYYVLEVIFNKNGLQFNINNHVSVFERVYNNWEIKNLFIGSSQLNNYQWNGVIQYIKILKQYESK